MARAVEAGQALSVAMEQVAGVFPLVAAEGRRRGKLRQKSGVATGAAGDGGFGELGRTGDSGSRGAFGGAGPGRGPRAADGGPWARALDRDERFWSPAAPSARKRASHFWAEGTEIPNPAATSATGRWSSTTRRTIPARLTGVSLALPCAFMRWRCLDRCRFHNPIFPTPPRMNNLLEHHS